MAEYILQILRSQLMVMFSWGPHNFKRLPGDQGLSFQVEGFKYQGKVKVVYDEGQDLFEVHLDNGQVEDMVYADCLVNVIDGLIERTDNYKERVETEYGIHVN
jgi:hypothetical protein